MIIRQAEFVISAVKPDQYPPGIKAELAVCGRSNVGKSTLMNKLLNRKGLVKVGKTPGKTRLINFFHINEQWYFVDLPGYGFAKVSAQIKAQWGKMMETYFACRKNLRGVVMLVDIRHKPTEDDRHMLELLRSKGLPTLLVATKADKISRGNRPKHLKIIAETLELEDWQLIIPFSAEDGTGLEELREEMAMIIRGGIETKEEK